MAKRVEEHRKLDRQLFWKQARGSLCSWPSPFVWYSCRFCISVFLNLLGFQMCQVLSDLCSPHSRALNERADCKCCTASKCFQNLWGEECIIMLYTGSSPIRYFLIKVREMHKENGLYRSLISLNSKPEMSDFSAVFPLWNMPWIPKMMDCSLRAGPDEIMLPQN